MGFGIPIFIYIGIPFYPLSEAIYYKEILKERV